MGIATGQLLLTIHYDWSTNSPDNQRQTDSYEYPAIHESLMFNILYSKGRAYRAVMNLKRVDLEKMYNFSVWRRLWCDELECLSDDWISVSSLWALLPWWILVSTFRAFESLFFFTRNLNNQQTRHACRIKTMTWWCFNMMEVYRGVSGSRRAHRPSIAPQRKCSDRVILHPNAMSLVAKLVTIPTYCHGIYSRL